MLDRMRSGRPIGLLLISLQKSVWSVALVLIAVSLLVFHSRQQTQPFRELFGGEILADPHDRLANLLMGLVPVLSLKTELLVAGGAVAYAILEAIEVWGLWRNILWVEIFIVVETAALLPYEIWEIAQHVSPFKVISFVINVLIVWYLATRYLTKRREHRARNDGMMHRV